MSEKNCKSCIFFDNDFYQCRRRSPSPELSMDRDDLDRFAVWPIITDPNLDWCGEWRVEDEKETRIVWMMEKR